MAAYQLFVKVSVRHRFYSDGICRGLQWEAGDGTAETLRRTGLLVRDEIDGFSLWTDPARRDPLLGHVRDARRGLRLRFGAYPTDPYFSGYSLPAVADGAMLLFDTRRATDIEAGARTLHGADTVDASSLRPASAPACRAALRRQRLPRRPHLAVQVVVTDSPDGLCAEGLDPGARQFRIRLDAAETYWKYHLRGALGARAARIDDLDGAVQFRRLDGASDAPSETVFMSSSPIPLREQPPQRFQLKEEASFGERILVKRMPNARAGLARRELVDGRAALVSEVFVEQ